MSDPDWVRLLDQEYVRRIDNALSTVREELLTAIAVFPKFNSAHEGYAVLLEEVDELWDEVKAKGDRRAKMLREAKQVAAMAVRFITDVEGIDYDASRHA